MQFIFKKEFSIETLLKAGVIIDHFMLHTSRKYAIVESWNKHKFKLVISMYGNNWKQHSEPINLIANYYGEKQAMYFAFLIHHTGWLLLPSFIGTLLFFYQFGIGLKNAEEGESWLTAYLNNVDIIENYVYFLFIAVWSTLYVESWKRKQNALRYMWGLDENFDVNSAQQKR